MSILVRTVKWHWPLTAFILRNNLLRKKASSSYSSSMKCKVRESRMDELKKHVRRHLLLVTSAWKWGRWKKFDHKLVSIFFLFPQNWLNKSSFESEEHFFRQHVLHQRMDIHWKRQGKNSFTVLLNAEHWICACFNIHKCLVTMIFALNSFVSEMQMENRI